MHYQNLLEMGFKAMITPFLVRPLAEISYPVPKGEATSLLGKGVSMGVSLGLGYCIAKYGVEPGLASLSASFEKSLCEAPEVAKEAACELEPALQLAGRCILTPLMTELTKRALGFSQEQLGEKKTALKQTERCIPILKGQIKALKSALKTLEKKQAKCCVASQQYLNLMREIAQLQANIDKQTEILRSHEAKKMTLGHRLAACL